MRDRVSMLKDKYSIEDIPVTSDFRREKRFIEDRGEVVLLKEFFRGGHYHKLKKEKFYVISGRLRILLKDV